MDLKKELRAASVPPVPKRRDAFLKSLPWPRLTYSGFILSQIGYIRKRMWLISALVVLAGLGTVHVSPEKERLIWVLSALVPLLAVITAAEVARSDLFGMAELESSCHFALPQITGARLLILGVCSFSVLSVSAILLGLATPLSTARAALSLLTPYCAVCGFSLTVFGRGKGHDGTALSLVSALVCSFTDIWLHGRRIFDESAAVTLSVLICAVGIFFTVHSIRKICGQKEFLYGTNC